MYGGPGESWYRLCLLATTRARPMSTIISDDLGNISKQYPCWLFKTTRWSSLAAARRVGADCPADRLCPALNGPRYGTHPTGQIKARASWRRRNICHLSINPPKQLGLMQGPHIYVLSRCAKNIPWLFLLRWQMFRLLHDALALI